MSEINIDGRRVSVRKGEYILAAARREGIEIPALCHHEAVEPFGACRLCVVEVSKPSWDGWFKVVTACLFPVEDDLVVRTNSDRVRRLRKEVLELLLARSPRAEAVVELARDYGIFEPRHDADWEGDNCILCGICTRICQTHVTGAISTVDRGVAKRVDTPFSEASGDCVGCLACARACPTGAIPFAERGKDRTIWARDFQLVPCAVCGAGTLTAEHAEWLCEKTNLPTEDLFVCDRCKVKRTADAYAKIAW